MKSQRQVVRAMLWVLCDDPNHQRQDVARYALSILEHWPHDDLRLSDLLRIFKGKLQPKPTQSLCDWERYVMRGFAFANEPRRKMCLTLRRVRQILQKEIMRCAT